MNTLRQIALGFSDGAMEGFRINRCMPVVYHRRCRAILGDLLGFNAIVLAIHATGRSICADGWIPLLILTVGWDVPTAILALLTNVVRVKDLEGAYRSSVTDDAPATHLRSGITCALADVLYEQMLAVVLVAQVAAVGYLPWFGVAINSVLRNFICSYYCFGYSWSRKTVGEKIQSLEQDWAFHVGYGMWLSVLTDMIGSYVSAWAANSVWWMLYPVYSMTATRARIPRRTYPRLKIFQTASVLVNQVARAVHSGIRSRNA